LRLPYTAYPVQINFGFVRAVFSFAACARTSDALSALGLEGDWVRLAQSRIGTIGFVSQKSSVARSCFLTASSNECLAKLGSFRRKSVGRRQPRNLGSFAPFSIATCLPAHSAQIDFGFVRRVLSSRGGFVCHAFARCARTLRSHIPILQLFRGRFVRAN